MTIEDDLFQLATQMGRTLRFNAGNRLVSVGVSIWKELKLMELDRSIESHNVKEMMLSLKVRIFVRVNCC